jgi:hypothetical protein
MSQKQKNLFYIFAFFFVVVVFLIATKNISKENVILVNATAEPEEVLPPHETHIDETADLQQKDLASLTDESVSGINQNLRESIQSFPNNIQPAYRDALKKDPHHTPEVVLQSAVHLGDIFDSVTNAQEATFAFEFFSKCTTNDDKMVTAIQTACFRFAKELATEFPSLQNQFDELTNNTSDPILQIVKFD